MARLVKCWNSTIICNEFLFGRSYTFELLGIKAGREEEETKQEIGITPSILGAFRLFLKMVRDIEQQRIVFSYSVDFFSESYTTDEVLNQTPLILDPFNPYNNVMSSFSPVAQCLFSDCAKETLKRLERVKERIEVGLGNPKLKEIFLPQLTPPASPVCMPQNWLIGLQSDEVLNQTPLILDHFNPYNNVMSSFLPSAQKLFSDCAKETLRRLGKVEEQIEKAVEFPHLKEIFLPQPIPCPLKSLSTPQKWLISVQLETLLQPRLIVRNAALNKKDQISDSTNSQSFFGICVCFRYRSNFQD